MKSLENWQQENNKIIETLNEDDFLKTLKFSI